MISFFRWSLRRKSYDELLAKYIVYSSEAYIGLRSKLEVEAIYDELKRKRPADRTP